MGGRAAPQTHEANTQEEAAKQSSQMRRRTLHIVGSLPEGSFSESHDDMNTTLERFIELIDQAVEIANHRIVGKEAGRADPAPLSGLQNVVSGLQHIRAQAVSGELSPSAGSARLGLSYTVLDWGEPANSHLVDIADRIERYYRENL